MKIHCIFGNDLQNGFHSIQYDGQNKNSFDELMEKWQNPVYIRKYCLTNINYLTAGFYGNTTLAASIMEIMMEIRLLNETLYDIAESADYSKLGDIFKPLGLKDARTVEISRDKLRFKGKFPKGKIRLYAIRLSSSSFIVTGGAIKVTQFMDDHPDTIIELSNINNVQGWLRDNSIVSIDDLNYYYDNEEQY